MARIIKETFTAWFQVLKTYKEWDLPFTELRLAWSKVKQGDNSTRGIMSNVISLLLELKWQPLAVDAWVSPKGETFRLTSLSYPIHLILKELVDSYNDMQFPRAALHHNGSVSYTHLRAHET